jgi:L-ornithine N5-oxygenase
MSRQGSRSVDIVGVGFGPANIALAIALEELGFGGTVEFIERGRGPSWQSEMMVAGADIQHNPLRDFVTPRNPVSPYGFLSYLHSSGRLWDYLNLSAHYPPRSEYAEYVKWVAKKFDKWTTYGRSVSSMTLMKNGGSPRCTLVLDDGSTIHAHAVSIGCGRSLHIPTLFHPVVGDRVVHTQFYLTTLARWRQIPGFKRIAVIGGSQSAAEVTLDLISRPDEFEIFNLTSGVGYRQKDLSPFTEQIYYPEYVDNFFNTSDHEKKQMTLELRNSNYSAADADVIDRLNLLLYEQKCNGRERLHLLSNTSISKVWKTEGDRIALEVLNRFQSGKKQLVVDGVLLATGFRNLGAGEREEKYPPLLKAVSGSLRRRADGSLYVTRDYRLLGRNEEAAVPPIFLNGLCESTHGFGDAGSFSLLALRASTIARSMVQAIDLQPIDTAPAALRYTPGKQEASNAQRAI